jgi:hypothetical protein
MKLFCNKMGKRGLTAILFLLTGLSNILLAAPRVATNPTGKTIDQVGDSAVSWFFDDIRPWIIVVLIGAGALGGWLGGRYRLHIAGFAVGAIVTLMALPTIISTIFGWM